eukprot:scaffold20102_cov161-Cylindrotheca_fusiformis.AAC.1
MDVRARHLGDGAWRRNLQVSASPSSPSISPSESYEPTNIPTSMPTIRGSNFGLTLLYVSGFCNGCPNELFRVNQNVGRRMSETTWAISTNDWVRSLEDGADEE